MARNLHQQPLYLEPEKAQLLDELSAQTRIPKAVLLRERLRCRTRTYDLRTALEEVGVGYWT